jgi:copper chaperone CopZ
MKKLLTVEGMSCGHCAMKVKSAIEDIEGVTKVDVDLLRKSAFVEGEGLSDTALRAAVAGAGYRVSAVIGSR